MGPKFEIYEFCSENFIISWDPSTDYTGYTGVNIFQVWTFFKFWSSSGKSTSYPANLVDHLTDPGWDQNRILKSLGPPGAKTVGWRAFISCPCHSPECPGVVRSNHVNFGGPWSPWAAAAIHGPWRPQERRQRRPGGSHGPQGPSGGPQEGQQRSQPRSGPVTGLTGPPPQIYEFCSENFIISWDPSTDYTGYTGWNIFQLWTFFKFWSSSGKSTSYPANLVDHLTDPGWDQNLRFLNFAQRTF